SQLLASSTLRISFIMSLGSIELVVFMLQVKRSERGFTSFSLTLMLVAFDCRLRAPTPIASTVRWWPPAAAAAAAEFCPALYSRTLDRIDFLSIKNY
ncbi:hypothetical protein BpHYR1_016677, partial [Brachionus plicatilis]